MMQCSMWLTDTGINSMRILESSCKGLTLKQLTNPKTKVCWTLGFKRHFYWLETGFLDENEATTSFLMQLSTWDKDELNDKLANRVQVSRRAVAKVIQAFDRLMQRNEKITLALKGELEGRMLQSIFKFTFYCCSLFIFNCRRCSVSWRSYPSN